jgi:LDH2 family malate/lactate/ureidoglycolate dehydrogenase
MDPRYNPASLRRSVTDLFRVAEVLMDADLLGDDTHGSQFVPAYLAALEAGRTRRQGDPEMVPDTDGTLVPDATGLPGQWTRTL